MTPDLSRLLLTDMIRIRAVEEAIAARYPEEQMRCPVHLSIGQEAPAAAIGAILRHSDLAVSGHRAHAHYLAKGGNLLSLISEIYGKKTGCSGGKGGSMHLIDESVGFMGSTAIVGGTVPVGVGLALSLQLSGKDDVVIICLGDAVMETGVFYEAANFSIVRNLPVIFLCENNLYSVYSPLGVRQPRCRRLVDVASGLGLNATCGDGNDIREAYNLINSSVKRIRNKGKPEFVELSTYRWLEHCGPNFDNDVGYRSVEEFESWRKRDPIELFRSLLISENIITQEWVEESAEKINLEIAEAFELAENSPYPDAMEAYRDLYENSDV